MTPQLSRLAAHALLGLDDLSERRRLLKLIEVAVTPAQLPPDVRELLGEAAVAMRAAGLGPLIHGVGDLG